MSQILIFIAIIESLFIFGDASLINRKQLPFDAQNITRTLRRIEETITSLRLADVLYYLFIYY